MPNDPFEYQVPKQQRAKLSEQAYLNALDHVLRRKSFQDSSVEEIAQEAGLTKAAFLRRFGSKRQAMYVLFERYCQKASAQMSRVADSLYAAKGLDEVLLDMSETLETLVSQNLSVNRAMLEDFLRDLGRHPLTSKIHFECVDLMAKVQAHFLTPGSYSQLGAAAAAQLLITINFNHPLNAMPSLPVDRATRHALIVKLLEVAIKE